jgi:hypothetical protein
MLSANPTNGLAIRRTTAALALLLSCLPIAQPAAWAAQASATAGVAGGPAVVRRLTESQYRATVADIFAPDIPVVGRFERAQRTDGLIAVGTSEAGLSSFSVEQYDASAIGIAAAVVSKERRAQLLPCQPKSETQFDASCAQRVIEHYGPLLFRRPLAAAETKRFVETARAGQVHLGNFYSGLQFALAGMMIEPDFLLRIERVEPDPKRPGQLRLDAYSKATRLSYFLTNSTPDRELLKAAGAGQLDTEAGLAHQVDRLMNSTRYAGTVRAFFQDMLQFDLFADLAKDPVIYPAYSAVVAADAQEQTLRTITEQLVAKTGDYRDLFTTQSTNLTRALGRVYALPVPTRNGWESTEFPATGGRAGILTDVSFLALHSHPGRSSPTLRGKAIREIFMCQKVPDPPANVDFTAFDAAVHDKASPTARDRLEDHQTNPTCSACHKVTDPLGLTLENFDGGGSFRAKENGADIDLSGSLEGVKFNGALGLGQALHDSPDVTHCLVDKVYRFGLGRKLTEQEDAYTEQFDKTFAANGYRVPDLMRAIATSTIFYAVSAPGKDQPGKTAKVKNDAAVTERADTSKTTGGRS